MSKGSSKFPPEVASCLWSYDPDLLDLKKDRDEIVTQVLNFGNWKAVKWLRKVYTDDDLRKVLIHPARGRWFKQALSFWLMELAISLPPEVYTRALFTVGPTQSVSAPS